MSVKIYTKSWFKKFVFIILSRKIIILNPSPERQIFVIEIFIILFLEQRKMFPILLKQEMLPKILPLSNKESIQCTLVQSYSQF